MLSSVEELKLTNKLGGIIMAVATSPQIDTKNLKTIADQLNYESLMNKKFNLYSEYCTDTQLKSLCNEASRTHKDNFNKLKTYLDSHQ